MNSAFTVVNLQQGTTVVQGQALATVENQELISLQQEYLDVQSRLVFQKTEYERQKLLNTENINAQKTFQQVSAEYNALQIKSKALEVRLSLVNLNLENLKAGNIISTYTVYAPVGGLITNVNVHLGEYVQPQTVLVELSNNSTFEIILNVFEENINDIEIAQDVSFWAINKPNQTYEATVYLINKQVNTDRTIKVHCSVVSQSTKFLLNTFVKGFITLNKTIKVDALPNEAFLNQNEKQYIFILKELTQQKPKPTHQKDETAEDHAKHDHPKHEKETQKSSKDTYIFELVEVLTQQTKDGYTAFSFKQTPEGQFEVVVKNTHLLLAQLKNLNGGEEGHSH